MLLTKALEEIVSRTNLCDDDHQSSFGINRTPSKVSYCASYYSKNHVVSPNSQEESSTSMPADGPVGTPLSVVYINDSERRDQIWRDKHPEEDFIESIRDIKTFENCLQATYPKLYKLRYLVKYFYLVCI